MTIPIPFPKSKDTIMRLVFFIEWSLASCFIDRGMDKRKGKRDGKEEKRIGKKQVRSFLLPVGFLPYTAKSEMVNDRQGQESGRVPHPLFINRMPGNVPVLYLSKRRPIDLYSEYQSRLFTEVHCSFRI